MSRTSEPLVEGHRRTGSHSLKPEEPQDHPFLSSDLYRARAPTWPLTPEVGISVGHLGLATPQGQETASMVRSGHSRHCGVRAPRDGHPGFVEAFCATQVSRMTPLSLSFLIYNILGCYEDSAWPMAGALAWRLGLQALNIQGPLRGGP